jgi:TetR/AcrR family transcriptional regulator
MRTADGQDCASKFSLLVHAHELVRSGLWHHLTHASSALSVSPPMPSTRPKIAALSSRRRPREDKRSAILNAGLGLFSRFGLHGTTVDQIAARADVSKSNLLYYFPNKEALYVAVLRNLLQVWVEPLRHFSEDEDPHTLLRNYIRAKLTLSRDQPEASRLFCLEMVQGAPLLRDDLARELRDLVEAKAKVIRAWVAQGRIAPIEPHHLLFALWAMTQHYADFAVQVEAITGRGLQDQQFFEETVSAVERLVLDGLSHSTGKVR